MREGPANSEYTKLDPEWHVECLGSLDTGILHIEVRISPCSILSSPGPQKDSQIGVVPNSTGKETDASRV